MYAYKFWLWGHPYNWRVTFIVVLWWLAWDTSVTILGSTCSPGKKKYLMSCVYEGRVKMANALLGSGFLCFTSKV